MTTPLFPAGTAMTTDQYVNYMDEWRKHWEVLREQDKSQLERMINNRDQIADQKEQREHDRQVERDRLNFERQRERDAKIEMDKLKREAMQAAQAIPQCDGSSPEQMRDWLREIDMSRAHVALTLTVAFHSCRGSLRRTLSTFTNQRPDKTVEITWEQAKAHLQKVFLSPKEIDKLRCELQAIQQGPYESTPQFCMRFTELVDLAYPLKFDAAGQPAPRTEDAQGTILDAFLGGLSDKSTAHMCLHFGKPKSYTDAIDFVSEFDANNAKLDITRQKFTNARIEEPMDISAVNTPQPRPTARDNDLAEMKRQVCGLTTQFTKLMASLKQSNPTRSPSRESQPSRPRTSPNGDHAYTDQGRPICSYCQKVGHVQRFCRSKLADRRRSNSQSSRHNQGGH